GCAGNAPERFESIELLDAQLLGVAREEAGLRLRLGQVLELMQRKACCFELGFSSLVAYALERCERGARWVEVASCLARRLEVLPLLRRALATGCISWSKAELLARVAQPENEASWLELAERHTLRELRREASEARDIADADDPDGALTEEREATGVLTCTLEREDAWLLEATRALLDQFGTRGAEDQVEALLAEGQGALLAALPVGALDLEGIDSVAEAQQRWREQLGRWRTEAEVRCEPRIRAVVLERTASEGVAALLAAQGMSSLEGCKSRELDGEVRCLAAALAEHELKLSRLLWRFHRADGWRRLGYATETQYARERLGLSRSSVLARRSLAMRLEALPHVAQALGRAEVGVEAALQLVRIATPQTELAWLERARQRTVKHLREEVSAALTAVRLSGDAACPPPRDDELERFQELERAVLSGRVWGGTPNRRQPGCALDVADEPLDGSRQPSPRQPSSRRPWREMLSSLTAWLEQGALTHAVQMSADRATRALSKRSAGRVEVRWRVSLGLRSWWHSLEACARPWLPRGMSWVKFLCLAFWQAWSHMLGLNVAWGQVYLRDRCRCSSPVCSRRDVTPHHLRFRSAGGSDADDNMASLCTWCHLFGVHGGRIRATGSAGNILWELGAREAPCVRVQGRQRC
ncbi:MAG: hypothetical protein ABI895_42430, partial [Deltaproteobacteria bacterium]